MRRSGQTLAMVQSLDHQGAVIVTHTEKSQVYIEQMVHEVRPDLRGKVKVIVVRNHYDLTRLSGIRQPTYIDHAVWFGVEDTRTLSDLEALVNRINAKCLPAPY
jgi:hypothetical protein